MSNKERVEETEVWEGPGAMLRRVREAKGLDVPAVAGMLHLSEKKLEALEADDFDLLPEPVYIRGYLKNYARFLDEPAAPILDAYARLTPVTKSEKQPLLDSHVVEDMGSSGHDAVRIVSILLIVVVIVLPIILWWDYLELAVEKVVGKAVQFNEQAAPTSEAANRESGLSEFIQRPPQVSEESGPEAAPPAPEDNEEQLATTQTPQPIPEQAESATTNETAANDGRTVIPPPPAVTETVMQPAEPAQVVTTAPAQESAPASASKETVFEFIESSWVKVRDNNDQVVLIGEYKKGETKRLSGRQAPYKVVLGDSSAVKVKIDGKLVDLAEFSSGGVSRFTIKDGKLETP